MFSRQFDSPQGNDSDKAALIKQLSESFHDKDLQWLQSPDVHVQRTAVRPSELDWQHRDEWQATHEPGKVKEKRKDIKHGNDKPVAVVQRPHEDNLMIMDGHHHAEAYTQLLGSDSGNKHVQSLHGQMPVYKISVPKTNGPWDTLHDKQEHNKYA